MDGDCMGDGGFEVSGDGLAYEIINEHALFDDISNTTRKNCIGISEVRHHRGTSPYGFAILN